MKQYLDLCHRIVNEGKWVENERTGKRCLTVINADLTYNVATGEFPLVTTRRSFWKAAIAELLGYIRAMIMPPISANWEQNHGMPMQIKTWLG
ncbi:thymidylate synthase [Actinobacillus pleuropneumoniae]|nr:thymidylate synthase [Actinobacillus pleuropneumoniae]